MSVKNENEGLVVTEQVVAPRARVSVTEILTEIQENLSLASPYFQRMEDNDKVRYCEWDGQSTDGRKHEEDLGEEAFPYEGASDQRLRIAAILVEEACLLCKAAMVGGQMQAVAVDGVQDVVTANGLQPMLKHQMTLMRFEVRDEIDFLLDWMNTYGHAVMKVGWLKRSQLERRTVAFDDLVEMAVSAGLAEMGLPDGEQIDEAVEQAEAEGQQVIDPQLQQAVAVKEQMEAVSIESLQMMLLSGDRQQLQSLLQSYDPDMPKEEVRRVVKELGEGIIAEYLAPFLIEDRCTWSARCTGIDLFYPYYVNKIQDSPWVAETLWYTRSQLLETAETEGWDETGVQEVLKHPGRAVDIGTLNHDWALMGNTIRRTLKSAGATDMKGMYQVIIYYYRASSNLGAPCIYREVLHDCVKDRSLLHEVIPDWHGRMPFVEFRRNRKGPKELMSVQGIPEEMSTHQNAIKAQHDARTNRTDMTLNPPALVPRDASGGRYNLGPNAQIPMRRSGTLEFMKLPPMDMDSMAITAEEWNLLNIMYGRPMKDVPESLVRLHQQARVNDFLTSLAQVSQMTYDLCQEHVSPQDWQRITEQPKPPMDRKQLDVSITFDVTDLNWEQLKKKLEFFTAFGVPNDSEGVINRGELVKYVFSAIDPVMAARLVRNGNDAAQREEEDELYALSVIMAGEEPLQKPGQNHQLRANVLERAVQRSMEIQRKLSDPASEQIREVYQARLQFHLNQVQQQQNAVIGRTMVQSAMGQQS